MPCAGNKYYFVESGDGCANIASAYSITLANFYKCNPAVGTACQPLQAGYYVCVGESGRLFASFYHFFLDLYNF